MLILNPGRGRALNLITEPTIYFTATTTPQHSWMHRIYREISKNVRRIVFYLMIFTQAISIGDMPWGISLNAVLPSDLSFLVLQCTGGTGQSMHIR